MFELILVSIGLVSFIGAVWWRIERGMGHYFERRDDEDL